MSKTASWSYTNKAYVKPFISVNEWNKSVYGDEYEISCTWIADKNTQKDGSNSNELIIKNEIFTEDNRPKRLDLIRLNGRTEFDEIQQVVEFDMSFFNELPDYKIVT